MSNFSFARLSLVARKEIVDLLRDRKSIFLALFGVAISGPLVVCLLYFVAQSIRRLIDEKTAHRAIRTGLVQSLAFASAWGDNLRRENNRIILKLLNSGRKL